MMPTKFNCSPKFDQPVIIPSREKIRRVCDEFWNANCYRVFLVSEFIKEFGGFVAARFGVNVNHARAIEVDPVDINIAAYYDGENDEFCKIAIELVLITNIKEDHIVFDQELYGKLTKRLADSLAHELIHMRQARARDFIPVFNDHIQLDNENHELIYLSNPDEIDAYAHNIAAELTELVSPLSVLQRPSNITIENSLNLWVYMNAFGKSLEDPILRRLLKKIYKHLDK